MYKCSKVPGGFYNSDEDNFYNSSDEELHQRHALSSRVTSCCGKSSYSPTVKFEETNYDTEVEPSPPPAQGIVTPAAQGGSTHNSLSVATVSQITV
ncbi:hypothetical protein FRC15_006029 [Serendipita sp. 397]|nr:hypothetical protein FRC15_006029 [Serendipita sp. 397]KAG8805133.1 hypothetical protein FRC18_006863 [Serendipita sp. 400]